MINKEDKNKRIVLDFQLQEVDTLVKSLKDHRTEEYKKCKWELQGNTNHHWYTPNKRVKQINFTINSIQRQLNSLGIEYDVNKIF